MSPAPAFQPGGTVREEAVYVERAADQELLDALEAGELCSVLAPRQIGKSSLRVRTARRLRERGARVATVDLTRIGGHGASPEGWYFGIVQEISSRLGFPADPIVFWNRNQSLTPVHRFARFLREEALAQVPGRLVLFVDEIDTVLALPFSGDDFFAALREAYNLRAEDPAYRRLGLCLLGVATPAELVRDSARTPFNVGRAIALRDFTGAEARSLLPALGAVTRDPEALLAGLLAWTSGHPYMTMRLCDELSRRAPADALAAVDPLVAELFLASGRVDDPNLAYAARRLAADPRAGALLHLYRRLLEGQPVAADPGDPVQAALCLTGVAAADPRARALRVRNRIFAAVLDGAWTLAQERERLVAGPLQRWLDSGRGDDLVLRGQALEEARRWAGGRRDLAPEINEFLLAGLAVALREEGERREAERERAARERAEGRARALRRTLLAVGSLALLLCGALAVALVEYRRAEAARSEAELALQREKGALASALAQQRGREEDAVQAGIEAVWPSLRAGVRPPAVARSGLADAVLRAAPFPQLSIDGWRPSAEYSADGAHLFAYDQALRVWDLAPLAEPRWFRLSDQPLLRAALSADGRRLAASGADGVVHVLEAETGAELLRTDATAFAWDSAGRLALGGSDGRVRWQPLDGGAAPALVALGEPVADLAATPDGARLFAQLPSGLRALDGRTGRILFALPPGGAVQQARLSPDGSELATADGTGEVRFFDALSGAPRGGWRAESVGKAGGIAWSSDGRSVLVAFLPSLEVRDRRTGAVLQRLTDAVSAYGRAPAFADGDRLALLGDVDGRIRFYSAPDPGDPFQPSLQLPVHHMYLNSLVPSADGKALITAGGDGIARILPLGFERPRLSLPETGLGEDQWSAAGPRIVGTDLGLGRLNATDAITGAAVSVVPGGAPICCGAGAPDGRFAALQQSGSRPGGVRNSGDPARLLLFDAAAAPLPLPGGLAVAAPDGTLGFTPDGSELLFGDGGRVRRLELSSGRELAPLEGLGARLRRRLAWSRDGERVALAATTGEVDVFERRSARRLLSLKTAPWPQATFAADGASLYVADLSSLREWSLPDGELLLAASASPWRVLAVSSAGEALLSDRARRVPLGLAAHLRAGCLFLAGRGAGDPVREACAAAAGR